MCRIADVLLVLQQHGHVKYIGWQLYAACNICDIERLHGVLSMLENDLNRWLSAVSLARNEFYELNYFTTPQLLTLREELGKLKSLSAYSIQPDTMVLLQSIARNITVNEIRNVMQHNSGNMSNELVLSNKNNIVSHDSCETVVPVIKTEFTSDIVLSDDQKVIMDNLKDLYGFSEGLLEVALQHFSETPIEEAEVLVWCQDHQADSDILSSDSKSFCSSESEMSRSDSDYEEDIPVVQVSSNEASQLTSFQVHIRPFIDENHLLVKELVASGYDVIDSIAAIRKYPENLDKAIGYFMDMNDEDMKICDADGVQDYQENLESDNG